MVMEGTVESEPQIGQFSVTFLTCQVPPQPRCYVVQSHLVQLSVKLVDCPIQEQEARCSRCEN